MRSTLSRNDFSPMKKAETPKGDFNFKTRQLWPLGDLINKIV